MADNKDGIIRKLHRQNLLKFEQEFIYNVHYEVITGSVAYGMNTKESSDTDVVGICVPPINWIFPHVDGHIPGFGHQPPKFDVSQQHHINLDDKQYDVAVYSIVKFFQLAAENNPNIVDLLFVHERLITHIDNIGKLIRQNRKLFLHKGAFHKFKGYAFAQMKKMDAKNPKESRKELLEKYGFDTKHASHIFRLALECEQLLNEGELDLERHNEILKAVRRGEYKLEEIHEWFKNKELQLNQLYVDSKLPYSPNWDELKRVLLCCLEEKYGSLSALINTAVDPRILRKFEQIKQIVNS